MWYIGEEEVKEKKMELGRGGGGWGRGRKDEVEKEVRKISKTSSSSPAGATSVPLLRNQSVNWVLSSTRRSHLTSW